MRIAKVMIGHVMTLYILISSGLATSLRAWTLLWALSPDYRPKFLLFLSLQLNVSFSWEMADHIPIPYALTPAWTKENRVLARQCWHRQRLFLLLLCEDLLIFSDIQGFTDRDHPLDARFSLVKCSLKRVSHQVCFVLPIPFRETISFFPLLTPLYFLSLLDDGK